MKKLTKKASRLELFQQMWLNRRCLLAFLVLLLRVFRSFCCSLNALFFLFRQFLSLLAGERLGIMRLEPLAEWDGVDGDDRSLDQCFGANQLIVGCIVNRVDDAGFAGASLNKFLIICIDACLFLLILFCKKVKCFALERSSHLHLFAILIFELIQQKWTI